MSYTKPEVTILGSAVEAIQGNNKGSVHQETDHTKPNIATVNAYEADE